MLFCFVAGLSACQRASNSEASSTSVTILAPGNLDIVGVQSLAMPADRKICYGVNVVAADIPIEQSGSCHPPLHLKAGFVESGQALFLAVPTGTNRTFELYAHIISKSSECPSWDATFQDAQDNFFQTYLIGKTVGVNLSSAEQTVNIEYEFPGDGASLASQSAGACGTAPKLHALIYSDGQIAKVSSAVETPLDISYAYIEYFYELILGGLSSSSVQTVTSSQQLNLGNDVQLPEFLRSPTRKPENENQIFAIDLGGSVYQLNAQGSIEPGFVCPFETCELPPWVQSISAGRGQSLFALDHAGQIYRVRKSELVQLGVTVNEAVTQILFY